MLALLGIKELRPSASSDARSPQSANFDEAKANVYPNLPDPLVEKNGRRVTTPAEWWSERRPRIVEDYDREILGRPPAHLPAVTWQIVSSTPETIGNVAVVTRRLAGHVDNSFYSQISVTIDATLTTPAHAAGPVPVVMQLAFAGEFKASMARPLSDKSSGAPGDYGQAWESLVLARGWGFAVLSPTSFQADDGAGLTEGIIGLMNKGQPRSLDDWGTMRAWAWGASHLLDYLETDKTVDARQVAIEGHSRFGKTALVAMAYDPRFAVLYSSSSGEGGAKLYRHIFGEPLAQRGLHQPVPLVDGQLPQVRRPAHPRRSACRQSRTDRALRPAPCVHRCRVKRGGWVCESQGRRLGRRARHVPCRGRRRPSLPPAGQNRTSDNPVSARGDRPDRWRSRLPPALRRPHPRSQLAHVSRLRRKISAHKELANARLKPEMQNGESGGKRGFHRMRKSSTGETRSVRTRLQ